MKRTDDGAIVEFRSVVDAVRCAVEILNAMVERNSDVPSDRRIARPVAERLVRHGALCSCTVNQ